MALSLLPPPFFDDEYTRVQHFTDGHRWMSYLGVSGERVTLFWHPSLWGSCLLH